MDCLAFRVWPYSFTANTVPRVSSLTPRPVLPTVADIRDGPYSHLNPAAIQDALYRIGGQLPDSPLPTESQPSPAGSSSTALSTQSIRSLWKPYRTTTSPGGNTNETIAHALWIIKKQSIKSVRRLCLEDGIIKMEENGEIGLGYQIAGSETQFDFLPMRPTKLNKELVRIRKYTPLYYPSLLTCLC